MRKRYLINFLGAGAMAAGMAFAQTPSATSQPATAPPPSSVQSQQSKGVHNRAFMKEQRAWVSKQLNLSDAQKAQAKAIFGESRMAAKPIREQLQANRLALRAAVKADKTSDIHVLSMARGNLQGKLTAIRTEAAARFYNILSPQQRIKADQLHTQFRQQMLQRRGEGA